VAFAHIRPEGYAQYVNSAAQAIPTNTLRKVYLPVSVDTSSDVAITAGTTGTGSFFTLNRAGIWRMSGGIGYGFKNGSTYRQIAIGDDFYTYKFAANSGYNNIASLTLSVSVEERFAAGQPVALWAYHEGGSDVDISAPSVPGVVDRITHFSMTWIRP
jgi:hypothetical protein